MPQGLMLLSHGSIKRTQKTPQGDLEFTRKTNERGDTMTKTNKPKNPHVGSTHDDFLKEQGIYEDVPSTAIKRVLALQLEQAMKERKSCAARPTPRSRQLQCDSRDPAARRGSRGPRNSA
jgi:hypothetical protein